MLNQYINKSYYNIYTKKIFFFSDIEGSNVFVDLNKEKIDDLKDIEITNGIITNIKNNISLVFLGDLIDNSIYDIQLMKSMNKMKKKNPNNIILITGNRDLNKLLLLNEFIINNKNENVIYEYLYICKNEDILNCYITFVNFCKYISKNFRKKYHFMTNNLIYMLTNYQNKHISGNFNKITRIKYIYRYLLNAPFVLKNRKKEIENILNLSYDIREKLILTKKENCAFVLLMNMILFGNYETKNTFVNKFKNIEMEYLLNTHLLTLINYNSSRYLLSHSYIPNDGILSVPFASNYRKKYTKQTNLECFLFWLNKIFIKHLLFLSKCYVKNTSQINFFKFNKYINNLMSMCSYKYLNHKKTNVNNANIVTRQYKLYNLYGGNIENDTIDIKNNCLNYKKSYYDFFDNSINKIPIDYLIIGHTPFGSIPTIETRYDLTTKIIHLDVSKGDGVPVSKKTFCFFVATPFNNYFIGRIHLVNSSKNKKLNIKYYTKSDDIELKNLFFDNKLKKNIINYYKFDIDFLIKNNLFQKINEYIKFILHINDKIYMVETKLGNYQTKFLNEYFFYVV